MFFVYGKVCLLVPISKVFWEQFFSSEVMCISFWETSDLLVKCLHHKRKASLIISYYIKQDMIQIIQSSVNFLWIALGLDLEKYLPQIDVLTQKTNWFLKYIKRLYEQVFFAMQFKNLCINERFNIKKCRKILEFLLLVIFQLIVFKVCCLEIKVSTYNRFLLSFFL